MSKVIDGNPDSGLLNAIMADVYGDLYAFDIPDSERAFEKFGELAEKAFALNPRNALIRVILAYKCFIYDEKERFFTL